MSQADIGARTSVTLGNDPFSYTMFVDWARVPAGMSLGIVSDVSVDGDDNVYVFVRGTTQPVVIFDRAGNFLGSWGEGEFVNPHGLHIGRDGAIYCTDDGKHVVRKYTLEGKLLLELGTPGVPVAEFSGGAFNKCTHTALSPDNEMIYVSDGYKNARVHKFSQAGKADAIVGTIGHR